MIGTANFAELLWPGLAELFGHKYERYATMYSKIFDIRKATKAFEKIQGVTGLGLAGTKNQGQGISYVDPMQGFQEEIVMVAYALGVNITHEMVEDEQYDYIRSTPDFLSESMRQTEETIAFDVINRAQNASYTGADGSTLVSATHAQPPGGTFSNLITSAADLTQTSLEALLQQLQDATDDQGLKINLKPKCLLVPTASNFRARKLLESSYVTGSADNDVNPIPGLFEDLVVSPFLTDTDMFAIITNCRTGLIFFRREATRLMRDNEFDTMNMKIATYGRFGVGWGNPRTIYFSPGV